MLLGMIFRLYSEIFVEIHALFLEILRFQFVTLFVKRPVEHVVHIYLILARNFLANGWSHEVKSI